MHFVRRIDEPIRRRVSQHGNELNVIDSSAGIPNSAAKLLPAFTAERIAVLNSPIDRSGTLRSETGSPLWKDGIVVAISTLTKQARCF